MKKIILFIFLIMICIAVPAVALAATDTPDTLQMGSKGNDVMDVQQALRNLGYLNFRVTGKYSSITSDAVRRFQLTNHLPADGQVGESTYNLLLTGNPLPSPINPKFKLVHGPYLQNPTAYGELAKWSDVNPLFPAGSQVTIKDLYSDKTFQMQRTGGVNNARVETVSQPGSDVFTAMFGGEVTWEKRPVLATINGKTYAAALFGGPDGEDTLAGNGMQGGTQLYFFGSASDVFGIPDEEMNSAVTTAAGK